jgi:hypothetical protein
MLADVCHDDGAVANPCILPDGYMGPHSWLFTNREIQSLNPVLAASVHYRNV